MAGYQYREEQRKEGGGWTPEREALLIALLEDKVRPCAIAKRLGITSGMVAGKIDRIRRRREKERLTSRRTAPLEETAPPKPTTVLFTAQTREDVAHYPYCEPAEPRDTTCKWPAGDPMSPEFHLCGKPTTGRGSYCAKHAAISRQPRRA